MAGRTIRRRFTDEMARRLKPVTLGRGGHRAPAVRPQAPNSMDSFKRGLCVMEAVAYVTGQEHTEAPKCVSEIIAGYLMGVNDHLTTTRERNLLKQTIPEIVGTRPLVPMKTASGKFVRDEHGEPVLRGVTIHEHRGYAHAEKRREALLGIGTRDPKEAVELVKQAAAITNRAPRK